MRLNVRSASASALAIAGFALIGAAFMPKAHADAWDKMTYVTVNESIIAGNKVLDPGTYVWKLYNSPSDRHVVQIFDRDQRHLETTILAIPNYRLEPTGHTQFAFWETPAGVPKAVRAWFYPGDNFGQEFPYPKKLVAQLASAAPVSVPETYTEPTPEPQPAPEAQPEPTPAPEPTPEVQPQPEAQPQPQPQAQQPQTEQPAPMQQPTALPHTASFNPLIGLLGLASLGFAGLLGLATKRS